MSRSRLSERQLRDVARNDWRDGTRSIAPDAACDALAYRRALQLVTKHAAKIRSTFIDEIRIERAVLIEDIITRALGKAKR